MFAAGLQVCCDTAASSNACCRLLLCLSIAPLRSSSRSSTRTSRSQAAVQGVLESCFEVQENSSKGGTMVLCSQKVVASQLLPEQRLVWVCNEQGHGKGCGVRHDDGQ